MQSRALNRIMPALIHIQAHLDQDLSLDLLADEAGLSKYHFHQLFRTATGETPKMYVDRLRLERAALQLRIRQSTVLEIALECGYQNHETFTRAFRSHFAMSPSEYRRGWPTHGANSRVKRVQPAKHNAKQAALSPTRIVQLTRVIVAFVRHLGPYRKVSPDRFDRLRNWARRRGVAGATSSLIGIAHDAPGITPTAKIRFDCCIQVPEMLAADGDIACQRTPGGTFAITDYVGSWDLQPAYTAIVQRLRSNPKLEIIGLPALEIYQTTRVGRRYDLAHVSIAIPVKTLRGAVGSSPKE